MFKLLSADLPTTTPPAPKQDSTPAIRLWQEDSRSMAPVGVCNYPLLYLNAVGLQPIVYHALDPIFTGVYYRYAFPFKVLALSVLGCNEVESRVAVPESFWFNEDSNTVCIYKASKAVSISVELAVSTTALPTTTTNQYQIDTSTWGSFTTPSPIAVDGITFPYSPTLGVAGTYAIDGDAIFVYTSAPLPVGDTLIHVLQDLTLTPVAAIVTCQLPEFTLVSDYAGRVYLRALNTRSPEVYEFLSDDEQYISLYLPTTLFAGSQVEQPVPVNGLQAVTSITY